MATEAGWGAMDPNSDHQLWSRWTFVIEASKYVRLALVKENALKWLRMGFGSVGRARITESVRRTGPKQQFRINRWVIECEVEGPPAHDPEYVESVRAQFQKFAQAGWGQMATGSTEVRVLAGNKEGGKPRDQMLVIPTIEFPEHPSHPSHKES